MLLLYFSSFLIYLLPSSRGYSLMQDEGYNLLPPIYEMSDYQHCNIHKNAYCRADLKLRPFDRNSRIWELIEETRKDKLLYNHDEISRTVCVPTVHGNNLRDVERFIENAVNKQVEGVNLTSTVEYVNCKKFSNFTKLDHFFKNVLFGYFLIIIVATVYDAILKENKESVKDTVLRMLSLKRNYRQLFDTSKGSHYEQLKCIQGLRVFTCTSVITAHTTMSFIFTFVENTIYIEEMYYKIFYIYYIFGFFVTQIFSLVSVWLLTVQVLTIFEANKQFTVKDALLIFINRCCRLWPALIFFVVSYRKAFLDFLFGSPLSEVSDTTATNCEEYGLYTLLFLQNHLMVDNMCNLSYWFISTDVQLHVMSLVVLYLILKLGSVKKLLAMFFFVSYGLFSIIIYANNLDIVFRPYPENLKWQNVLKNKKVLYLYTMPHVNMATYLVGVGFGICYYNIRQWKTFNKKIFDFVWISSFFGLPLLATVIASKEFRGLSAALIGPVLKPMYTFGIGMGILGMSQSKDGIIKKIFEWRPLEFLSQFTYSVYIYHFVIVFYRTAMSKPLKISNYILVTSAIQDTFLGFLLGFIMYLLVELPWSNIQKEYLPQVKKKSIKNE